MPTIAIIIGEGGSGGAIALASSNKVIMLENAIYSVISPEGCATILWRDPKKMLDAAKAMKLSAKDLLKLKVIDEIIPEPLGGAHRDRDLMLDNVRKSISKNLDQYKEMTSEDIMNERKNKFLKIGRNDGFMSNVEDLSNLTIKKNNFDNIFKSKKLLFGIGVGLLFLAKNNKPTPIPNNNFFDLKMLSKLFFLMVKLLKSSTLLIKPSFLPIFKNLFFLSFIISSDVISLY